MSQPIRCLIVDDEPIAREIVQTYCSHLPALEVVASCANALEAKSMLQSQSIHLVFLDINMPVLDGIAFLKTLKNPPQVIFTTAYKEFALDAFDLSAADYLLKPFSLERFIMAVDKAIDRIKVNDKTVPESSQQATEEFTFIKTEGKIYKVFFPDLLYAEASGNYTKIVTTQQTITPTMAFSAFEELLPKSQFVRIHRSFIINKSRIAHLEGNRVFINGVEIPIGSSYKENLMKELGLKM